MTATPEIYIICLQVFTVTVLVGLAYLIWEMYNGRPPRC